ncbi:YeeE/YedE family protein [Photobacterium kagoshimensis]
MFTRLITLIAGVLFGLGMMISGMVDPVNVIGFLDITGDWNPSLMFVMGGALMVFMPIYFLVVRRLDKPVCDNEFKITTNNTVDPKLLTGATLFGIGWGIAGVCPGPAVTSLSGGNLAIVAFTLSMLIGFFIVVRIESRHENVG